MREIAGRAVRDERVDIVAADAAQHLRETRFDLGGFALAERAEIAKERRDPALRRCAWPPNGRPARSGAGGRPAAARRSTERCRASCRSGWSACRRNCCRPCRRSWRARRWRRRPGTRARAASARGSARQARCPAARHSGGSRHRSRRCGSGASRVSRTSASLTVCPHCDVPPPRGSTVTPFLARNGERGAEIGLVPRDDDADRHHLIERGVRRVAAARKAIEEHVALRRGAKSAFQRGSRRAGGHQWSVRMLPCTLTE